MNVYYTRNGVQYTLTLVNGMWTGGHDDIAKRLNESLSDVLGRYEYYPTRWHEARAVAEFLGGMLDAPQPAEQKRKKGEVF